MAELESTLVKARDFAVQGTCVQEGASYIYGCPVGQFTVVLTSKQERPENDYELCIWDQDAGRVALKARCVAGHIALTYMAPHSALEESWQKSFHAALESQKRPASAGGAAWSRYCQSLCGCFRLRCGS